MGNRRFLGPILRILRKLAATTNTSHKILILEIAGLAYRAFGHFHADFQKKPFLSHLAGDYELDEQMLQPFVNTFVNEVLSFRPHCRHLVLVFDGKCLAKEDSVAAEQRKKQQVSPAFQPRLVFHMFTHQ